MRKVLIIYKFLPEYRKEFYQNLKASLLRHDIELQLVYGKFNKTDALRKNEVEIDWAHYVRNRRFSILKTEFVWQPCLRYIRRQDLVIVQPENKLILNYYLMFTRHFANFKLAFWGHVSNMQDKADSRRNRFKSAFIDRCDWWFGYTKSATNFLTEKIKYPKERITVVQNAINTIGLCKYYSELKQDEVQNLKRNLGISGNNVGIYCGGMYPEKDFDFLLEACQKIRQQIPDFHMLFVGSGIEAFKIEEAAKANEWIHFIGPKFGYERVIFFKIASIQLMPKLVGLCILDSFALETPIVTTDHPFHGPEIDYLENGVNGVLTKDDINIYSKAVVEILKEKKYNDLIEAGKKSAERYTLQSMVENFTKGIERCLNS